MRISKYSPRFQRNLQIALITVLLLAFAVSAEKQTAASGLIYDDLPSQFAHISTLWSDISIVATLLLGEIGCVLFLIASGVIAESLPPARMFGYSINVIAWIFRAFALLCASYALIANVSITALSPVYKVQAYQWLVSVTIPLVVLGLGVMQERIMLDNIHAANESKAQFQIALMTYREALDHPERHELYKRALFDSLFTEMTRYKADRAKLDDILPVIETDQSGKKWLVTSEYAAHMDMAQFDITGTAPAFLSNPATPEVTEQSN